MILKYNLLATTILITQTSAFTPSHLITSRTSTKTYSLNSDWDNKDFLSALGNNPDELQKANDDYYALSGANQAKNEWLARSMNPPQSSSTALGATMGGDSGNRGPSPEFLEKMGVQPQQGGAPQQQQPPQQQMYQQPPPQQMYQQQQPPPQYPPQQQQFYDQNGNPIVMPTVYDANGNPIPYPQQFQPPPQQQFQQNQQPNTPLPPQYLPITEPPLPPKTKSSETTSKPIGYNADTYTISNTADVYFAQLKQDSKVRKVAWLSGDLEKANKVFDDDSVKSIGESWVDNPYTKEQNVREARAQIEGAVRMQVGDSEGGGDGKGGMVSYRERLEEVKRKRGGGDVSDGTVKTGDDSMASSVVAKPEMNAAPVRPPPQVNPVATQVGGPQTMPPKPMATQMPKPSTPSMNTPTQTMSPPQAASANTEEETRQKLRTLQGLLLKQRGGPGFGAGRLKAPEAQRLENVMEEVQAILREEVGAGGTNANAASSPQQVVKQPVQATVPKVTPAQPNPTFAQPKPVATTSSTPPESSTDPLSGTIACVESALNLYKSASPSERQDLLIPLREALMAAVGTSNKIIAEAELDAHRRGEVVRNPLEEGGTSVQRPPVQPVQPQKPPVQPQPLVQPAQPQQSAPTMGFPTSYNVAKPEPATQTKEYTTVTAGNNDNTKILEEAYNALKEASGDGKFGLKNISGNEASQLAHKLSAMRGILLDELN